MIVHTARWLLPVSSPPIANGAVAVDAAGRIAYVGPADGAPPGTTRPLGKAVLLPGLVAADAAPAVALRLAALRSAGVTTVAATCADDPDVDALVASGFRAIAFHRVAGPAPADRGPALAALRDAVARARATIAAAGATGRVRVGVAPGPIHTIEEELLLDVCAWAVGENLPLAIAAGADADEIAYIRDAAGPHADARRAAGHAVVRRAHSVVHLLSELGIAAVARPLLVGGRSFDASDVALAVHYDCPLAYVPSSDAEWGQAALAPVLDAGARVVVAVSDPLATAARLARTPAEALHLATFGAARALGLDADVGSLEVGKCADLCAFVLDAAQLDIAATDGPEAALLAGPSRGPLPARHFSPV